MVQRTHDPKDARRIVVRLTSTAAFFLSQVEGAELDVLVARMGDLTDQELTILVEAAKLWEDRLI